MGFPGRCGGGAREILTQAEMRSEKKTHLGGSLSRRMFGELSLNDDVDAARSAEQSEELAFACFCEILLIIPPTTIIRDASRSPTSPANEEVAR